MSEILKVLNRPVAKKQQDAQKIQAEKKRGPWIVRNIKWVMFIFFNTVALVFDGLAVTTVYTLTAGNYLLSALALLPTGVPMFMWEGGWLYPLASPEQKKRSIHGIILSIASAVIVGVMSILANLGDDTMRFWVSTALLVWCVGAVILHGYWAALYFYKDPIIQRDHELQVTIADNDYQEDTLAESENLLIAAEKMLTKEQELKQKFGEGEVNRALEILLGIDLNHDGKIGNRPANMPVRPPDAPRRQEMMALAKDTEAAELAENRTENPTSRVQGR